MAISYIKNECNDSDNISFGVVLRSKGARLPYVLPVRGMIRNQKVGNFDDFPRQRAFYDVLDAARAQPRKNFRCNLPEHLLRALTRQTLHCWVENLVAQFAVVNNHAFSRVLNDGLVKTGCVCESSFTAF